MNCWILFYGMRESLLQGIIFSIAYSEATSTPCLPVHIFSYCPPIDVSGRTAGTVLQDQGYENFPLHILGLEKHRFFRIMASGPGTMACLQRKASVGAFGAVLPLLCKQEHRSVGIARTGPYEKVELNVPRHIPGGDWIYHTEKECQETEVLREGY